VALVRNLVWTVNNISAETANHYIKDKKFQEIINKVLHKNNTLISIDLDSLWHLLKKTTNVMTNFYSTFFCVTLFNNISQQNYKGKRRNRKILQNEKITTDMQFDHFDVSCIKDMRDMYGWLWYRILFRL
jgi:hypothetical protein